MSFNKLIIIVLSVAIFSVWLIFIKPVNAAPCATPAKLEVIVRDTDKSFIPDASFQAYEQVKDVDEHKTLGALKASGKIDKYTGSGKITVTPDEAGTYYVIKVTNPSFSNLPFYFFDGAWLLCGSNSAVSKYLSALRLTITDGNGQILPNIKFTVWEQGLDAYNQPIIKKQLGSGSTSEAGLVDIYLPTRNTMLADQFDYYALEITTAKGQKFYRYNLNVTDGKLKTINYRLSDLQISLRNPNNQELLPNVKLNLHEQIIGSDGKATAGKLLISLTTDDQGGAYLQYPAGTYLMQFKYPDGRTQDYSYIKILDSSRNTYALELAGYTAPKCDLKSTIKLSFRSSAGEIVSDLSYILYEQTEDNDGRPTPGNRVGSGSIDARGLGQFTLTPGPAKRYLLQVCDAITKFGCFYFKNLEFQCGNNPTLERQLNQVDIILRGPTRQLLINQSFRLYHKIKNVDGKTEIDKTVGYGNFKLPASGKFSLYLAPQDLYGADEYYALMVLTGNQVELFADWQVLDGKIQLEYLVYADKLVRIYQPADPLAKKMVGRILLQVQSKGEAWFISPKDQKRYYLGRPEDAFAVMKKLSVGVSNADLRKIPVSLDLLSSSDIDSDADGLIDVLEKSLGTNLQKVDSDSDGYSDFEEIRNGYNPLGAGRQALDNNFAKAQTGKILLQVEGNGEAWLVHPLNYRRYYLGRPKDAFNIMRGLGLGVTNVDLQKISVGEINNNN